MSSELVDVCEVARILGVCKGRILREFVRAGALPWPDASAQWQRADVAALAARFEARRVQSRKQHLDVGGRE